MHRHAHLALVAACSLAATLIALSAKAQWAQPEDSLGHRHAVMTVTAGLDAAARSGNLDTIKAAAGENGRRCRACHEESRK
jgi:cytochrome c556